MRRALDHVRTALTRWHGRLQMCWCARRVECDFPANAEVLLQPFRGNASPSRGDYADLFCYFVTGFVVRRSRLGAYADYAGRGSYNGPAMDRLEGFSRIAPLIAAWLHGGRTTELTLANGKCVNLPAMLREGLLAGTDPVSKEYWGAISHWSQAIVEAADLALTLWLAREHLWEPLNPDERAQISCWLLGVNGKRIPDNNWHLFVVQVNAVLAALDAPHDHEAIEHHYARARAFYRGCGWFRDGERDDAPGFDYYNAWGFHYHLQWLRRIAPDLDAAFIDEALREFVAVYRYFIGPAGLPILGRSACYRLAAPVPLVFAQAAAPPLVSAGEARRTLDVVWQHFITHGAVIRGNVTQGYYDEDPRLLEDYSGPASCLWSLRALVAAFALPDDGAFWEATPAPLPIERNDYRIAIAPPGWTLVGERTSGRICIETGRTEEPELEAYTLFARIIGAFARLPHRPKNVAAKYHRARYDSSSPYGLAPTPRDD